jgi:futalosine hydrolase
MNCLLIAATAKEIGPFLDFYRNPVNSFEQGRSVDVLITGIGLTASMYAITKQLHLKRPDLVVQAGVAGCFDKKLAPGSVVAVGKETIADQSVVELKKLKTLFDLKLVPQDQPPYKKGWLVNPHKDLLKRSGLKVVTGVSVNEITTAHQKIKFYTKNFKPVVESMEGAALHYVALMERIPFLQIRSISNVIGERNKKKWDMNASIRNLNNELIRILT